MNKAEGLEYPFFETFNEMLIEAKDQIDYARNANSIAQAGARLRMAVAALKSACKIYGDHVAEMKEEKMDAKV